MQKWIMSAFVGFAGLLTVFLLLFNLPAKEEVAEENNAVTIPDMPVDTAAAETIYKSSCLPCHGDQFQGAMGPALDKVGATMSKEKIYKQIVQGGGGMPGYKDRLSEKEIVNLTNWLASFQ
ncbi:c-type cytochrome [Paenibacillus sinopodophylli]|uniref:c-type cytochrome n=1 Tax=Paenibacillus sinopodophylli TaxID=1837342 RepID=UPI001487388C|nr:cytochrome c [Paenibacillus sinopodophylli]